MSTKSLGISGSELAKGLLGQSNVDFLIDKLATGAGRGREGPILEFKASWKPKPGDNTTEDDCRWNVVKAIIAMANASGGCIVLGLAEDPHNKNNLLVGDADPDGILNDPRKEDKDLAAHTKSRLLKGNGIFHEGNGALVEILGVQPINKLQNLVEFHICKSTKYLEKPAIVVVIIVDPIAKDEELIYVRKRKNTNAKSNVIGRQILYHRNLQYAKTEFIEDLNEAVRYAGERSIQRPEFAQILESARPTPQRTRRQKVLLWIVFLSVVFVVIWLMTQINDEKKKRIHADNERVQAEKERTKIQDKYNRTLSGKIDKWKGKSND